MNYFCRWHNKAMLPLSKTSASCMRRGKACRKTMLVPVIGLNKRLPKMMLLRNTISASFITVGWV